MSHPRSLFGPLLLIAAGALWLLTKSGNIPTSNLWALTHIWPYVLIAAGIGLILRSYWKYASMFLDIVIIGGAVLAVIYAPQLNWDNPSMVSMMGNGDYYVGPSERGSGTIVNETRKVSDFAAISVDYPAQVFVTQGAVSSVKIEADDNVQPGLQTRVRNNKLEIFYKAEDGKHVNPTKMVKITIVVKDLKEVDFSSAGELNMEGLKTEDLDISISGAGNLNLNNLSAKKISVSLSGAGSMSASGKVEDFDLTISGFGSFDGKDLHCQTANVDLSGAGSATVWVDDQLDARISGAGSVNYYGSPEVTKQVSGIGNISKSGNK